MRFSVSTSAFAALALVLLPAALAAQTPGSTPGATRPVGCRGTSSQSSSVTLGRPDGEPIEIPGYGEIVSIQPGSPAERAGMRVGDRVVVQDGHDLVANPPTQPRLAGDTVQFIVRRAGREIPITVVLGAWDPPQETEGVERICRPVAAAPSRE